MILTFSRFISFLNDPFLIPIEVPDNTKGFPILFESLFRHVKTLHKCGNKKFDSYFVVLNNLFVFEYLQYEQLKFLTLIFCILE